MKTEIFCGYSVTQSCPPLATPWTAACQASQSITNSRSLLRLMSIELVMPSNHLILCCPLLHLPSIFPSIRDFSNELAHSIRFSNLDKPTTCYPYFAQEWIRALLHMDHLAISNLKFKIAALWGQIQKDETILQGLLICVSASNCRKLAISHLWFISTAGLESWSIKCRNQESW